MTDTIRAVMQSDPVTVSVHSSIKDAAVAMRINDIGDVLIVDGDEVRGILTDRDIVVRGVAMGRHPSGTLASDCCSTDVLTIGAATIDLVVPADPPLGAGLARQRRTTTFDIPQGPCCASTPTGSSSGGVPTSTTGSTGCAARSSPAILTMCATPS